jgi:hypothetical protein
MNNEPFRLGYTGPEAGMSLEQKFQLTWKFRDFQSHATTGHNGHIEAVHGGCIGGDWEFDHLCQFFELDIIVFPATNVPDYKCADLNSKYLKRTHAVGAPALARDKSMAKWCDFLVATPGEFVELQRSGVWATVRYYIKEQKPVLIIFPDGSMEKR